MSLPFSIAPSTPRGLAAISASPRGCPGSSQEMWPWVGWGRRKQPHYYYLFCIQRLLLPAPSFRAGVSNGPLEDAHGFEAAASHSLKALPKAGCNILSACWPHPPVFTPNFSRENAFSFTSPEHKGIFTCGCRTGARATTPAWQHLRLPCGVKWCRRHCVKGEGVFFSLLMSLIWLTSAFAPLCGNNVEPNLVTVVYATSPWVPLFIVHIWHSQL